MDKNIFFIFGTVRTRSTWMANLFTYKDSFCYNEESRYMRSLDELHERISKRPEKNVGFCDPELFHYIDKVYEMFPDARYLLLQRDHEECLRSHLPYVDFELTLDAMRPKFQFWSMNEEYLRDNVDYHEIHFDEIDNIDYVKRAWEYLLPDCYFDVDRFYLLDAMLIKVTLSDKPVPPYVDCLAAHFNYNHPIYKQLKKSVMGRFSIGPGKY